ncbi:unnamed protein product [Cochlearia groenlandica]
MEKENRDKEKASKETRGEEKAQEVVTKPEQETTTRLDLMVVAYEKEHQVDDDPQEEEKTAKASLKTSNVKVSS